jgi:hypothetical protein
MATSFYSQIPIVVHILTKLQPATMLDIGKGFGKYGFLVHEYVGVDPYKRPNPRVTLAEQSRVTVDAVESNDHYLWPHLEQFYRKIYVGRIEELYQTVPRYDLVLMADVIEHIAKDDGMKIVKYFVETGAYVVVSTPRDFFQQDLFESKDEHHVSFWTPRDFNWCHFDYQNCDSGAVYLLSSSPVNIRGFGHSLMARARRMARVAKDCL